MVIVDQEIDNIECSLGSDREERSEPKKIFFSLWREKVLKVRQSIQTKDTGILSPPFAPSPQRSCPFHLCARGGKSKFLTASPAPAAQRPSR